MKNDIIESGSLNVKRSGSVIVKLGFQPYEITTTFEDEDPSTGCCNISFPDSVSISELSQSFKISWKIKAPRKIKWVAKGR